MVWRLVSGTILVFFAPLLSPRISEQRNLASFQNVEFVAVVASQNINRKYFLVRQTMAKQGDLFTWTP